MYKVTVWFIKLKKWQKGSIIGLITGSIIDALMFVNPIDFEFGEWIIKYHELLAIPWLLLIFKFCNEYNSWAAPFYVSGFVLSILIFYTLFGIIIGKIQQIANPIWKWSLTSLVAVILITFYIVHAL